MSVIDPLIKGAIIEINDQCQIINNKVMLRADDWWIPVGDLEKERTWFSSSTWPKFTYVVYLGDYKFGTKQLTTPWIEFRELSEDDKEVEFEILFTMKRLPCYEAD